MIESNHVAELVPDYVLGLLPRSVQRTVEKHAAVCAECRQAILEEGKLAAAVRSTIRLVTTPDSRRLMELMPPIRRRRSAWRFIWERQFATVGLFILLLLGGWGIWQTHQRLIWINPSPTTLAATATMTEVPEVTMANTEPAHGGRTLFTAVATAPTQPLFVATPAPIPTPAVAPDAGY